MSSIFLEGLMDPVRLLAVMCSASSSRGGDVTPGHAAYRDALSHVIKSLRGASHFFACTLVESKA